MKLILARHAAPLSADLAPTALVIPDQDNHLTDAGREEAKALAAALVDRLGNESLRLVCSDSPRAVETIAPLEQLLGLNAERTALLPERNFGFPANTTSDDSRRFQENSHLNPEEKLPGGESRVEHRGRVQAWVEELRSAILAGDERTVVSVSHGGTIEHALMILVGAPVESSAHFFVPCSTAHYHVLELFKTDDGRLVWALQEINTGWSS